MAQDETAVLLPGSSSPRPKPPNLGASGPSIESTPLLSDSASTPCYDGAADTASEAVSIPSSASRSSTRLRKGSRRISLAAMALLAALMVAIIIGAFIVPGAVQEYAREAAVFEPTNVSIEEITTEGVRARFQANFKLDGSRVKNDAVRRVGRAVTWVVRELANDETDVSVYLPDYENALLGTASIPPLVFNIMDRQHNAVDFVANVRPGGAESYRKVVNQWLEGNLHKLRVEAKANVPMRSGIFPLGTHAVLETLVFEAKEMPSIPRYNISRLDIHDLPLPGKGKMQLGADVTITAFNHYPITFSVPELAFELLVPNCRPSGQIPVATALTKPFDVRAKSEVELQVRGLVEEIPNSLIQECPHSSSSPLDMFLDHYMHGQEATVYVRGGKQTSVPDWVGDILSSMTIPFPFPGRSLDGLLKEFSLEDVDFTLPDPFAEPGGPNADPKVSGTILATAAIPSEMNFEVNVTSVKAKSDVLYRDKKFGELNLDEWQSANSSMAKNKDKESELKIQSRVKDAPLTVTDSDVFGEVVQEVFLGNNKLVLHVKAAVDVSVETVLGHLVLKGIPAEGKIPVKRLPGGSLSRLNPQVGDVRVINTTRTSVALQALVNVTNPTPYSATVPYINIHVLCNGSIIGDATARHLRIHAGNNSNIMVEATWDPTIGGEEGREVGRELVSQYLSGWNTSITVKAHGDSIPSVPMLGKALSKLDITVNVPKLELPGETGDDVGHFIRDATFHVFSSTATFTLVSPLKHDTLYINHVNATAFYNHTYVVGRILHLLPFSAPPGASTTPRLPVDWDLGSIGYDAIRKALGRQLKLDAFAIVGIQTGEWVETVWYEGKGIGAHVSI